MAVRSNSIIVEVVQDDGKKLRKPLSCHFIENDNCIRIGGVDQYGRENVLIFSKNGEPKNEIKELVESIRAKDKKQTSVFRR